MALTKVKIGDTEIEVPQLTIGQLERVAEWLEGGDVVERTMKGALVHNRKLLAIGFERSNPKVSNEELEGLEATVQDVRDAVTSILRIAGLAPDEGTADPEVVAPEGALLNSSISSSASLQPDADTPLH